MMPFYLRVIHCHHVEFVVLYLRVALDLSKKLYLQHSIMPGVQAIMRKCERCK